MSYYYLASPYTAHPGGLADGYRLACEETARLLRHGVPVLSPIAHGHAIDRDGGPFGLGLSHDAWLAIDRAYLSAAAGLVWLDGPGAGQSHGMAQELKWAKEIGMPIYTMQPGEAPAAIEEMKRRVND